MCAQAARATATRPFNQPAWHSGVRWAQDVAREELHEAEGLEAALAGQADQGLVREHLLLVRRVLQRRAPPRSWDSRV